MGVVCWSRYVLLEQWAVGGFRADLDSLVLLSFFLKLSGMAKMKMYWVNAARELETDWGFDTDRAFVADLKVLVHFSELPGMAKMSWVKAAREVELGNDSGFDNDTGFVAFLFLLVLLFFFWELSRTAKMYRANAEAELELGTGR